MGGRVGEYVSRAFWFKVVAGLIIHLSPLSDSARRLAETLKREGLRDRYHCPIWCVMPPNPLLSGENKPCQIHSSLSPKSPSNLRRESEHRSSPSETTVHLEE